MYSSTLAYDTSVPPPGEDVTLTDYDGFATVQEPKQYLDAPAMLMTRLDDLGITDVIEFPDDSIGSTSNADSHAWSGVGPSQLPNEFTTKAVLPEIPPNSQQQQQSMLESQSLRLSQASTLQTKRPERQSHVVSEWLATVNDSSAEAVKSSFEAAALYAPLSDREFRECLAEIEAIESRMAEVAHILDVENKMHQAADSLSRMNPEEYSSPAQGSRKQSHSRSPSLSSLQKTLSPSRTSRRVSQWLSPKLNASSPKLPPAAGSAVWSPGRPSMSNDPSRVGLGLSGMEQPRSHKRTTSSTSQMAVQEMALSESHIHQLTYAQEELRRRKTALDCKIAQHHAAVLCRASCQSARAKSTSSLMSSSDLESITAKLQELAPTITPIPDRAKFIQAAIQWLVDDRENEHKKAQAFKTQADTSEERINYLAGELTRLESLQPGGNEPEVAQIKAERTQMASDYASEQRRCAEYRVRLENQRNQLEAVVRALEDVTSMAVGFERERVELRALIQDLEDRLEQTEEKAARAQASLLPENALPGALSKAYREIIHEVVMKHAAELRKARHLRLSAHKTGDSSVLDAAALAAADVSKSLQDVKKEPQPTTGPELPAVAADQAVLQPSPLPPSDETFQRRSSQTPKIPPRKRLSIQSPDDLL